MKIQILKCGPARGQKTLRSLSGRLRKQEFVAFSLNNRRVCTSCLQVLLTVETDTDEASEGEEEDEEESDQEGRLPHVHYSGGPLRPSWVVV